MNTKKIILASKSPRRSELLKQIGMDFTVLVSDADENIEENSPKDYVMSLSKIKATAVYEELKEKEDILIIGADTVVVHNDRILGKPKDREDAIATLKSLSGQVHEVMTGVTLIDVTEGNVSYYTFYEATKVHMFSMTEEEIISYVASGEPDDKAGSYAIQGLGAKFIEKIDGDYNNVVGLPISAIYQKLKELNINA